MERVYADVSGGVEGVFHLHDTKDYRTGRHMAKALLGILQLCPDARLGSSHGDVDSELFGTLSVELSEGKLSDRKAEKVLCKKCGFYVNPVNHVFRCRVVVPARDAKKELLGDAIHMLDVKLVVTSSVVSSDVYTIVVAKYASKAGQASYMRAVGVDVGCVRGDRDLSNEFERDYLTKYRRQYLDYLAAELGTSLKSVGNCYELLSKESRVVKRVMRREKGFATGFWVKIKLLVFLFTVWIGIIGGAVLGLWGFLVFTGMLSDSLRFLPLG